MYTLLTSLQMCLVPCLILVHIHVDEKDSGFENNNVKSGLHLDNLSRWGGLEAKVESMIGGGTDSKI